VIRKKANFVFELPLLIITAKKASKLVAMAKKENGHIQ
jgi:hypothetical protein